MENNRKWQHFERKIDSGVLGADPWYARRPVKLTLQNSSKSAVDFDNVQLLASDGKDLITNGSFTQRLDHWNFTSDNHLAWHIHALPVAVLFDQGLLGLMALGAVVLAACWRAARASWRGNLAAGAVLAALAAFLVLGAFDTLIDSPRFLMLLLLLCWLALLPWPKRIAAPEGNLARSRESSPEP